MLEAGVKNMAQFRMCVKGYCRDQGSAERGVASAPIGHVAGQVAEQFARLSAGDTSIEDVHNNIAHWPNCIETSDWCHIVMNALQESIENEPFWAEYEPCLKACCKILGDKSYKQVLLNDAFADASPYARMLLHNFSSDHVDWRWEYLECATDELTGIWEEFKRRFSPRLLPDSPSLVKKVVKATTEMDEFGPFTE
ncbi:unnamed protein product, partial [Prorocentrum cordatum]